MTGIVVIIGGIIFLSITGVMGGGSGSATAVDNGPSDAEIAAAATLQAATIQANAAITQAQIGAGTEQNQDNLAAAVAMKQIDAAKEVQVNTVNQQANLYNNQIMADLTKFGAVQNIVGTTLKGKDRAAATQALITGQPYYYPAKGGPSGNDAGSILNGIANVTKGVSGLVPFL